MDDKRISQVKARLTEVNKIISALDPAIRAAAFDILAPMFFEDLPEVKPQGPVPPAKLGKRRVAATTDRETFFSSFEHDKPHENVHLIAAWLYSRYGVFPVETRELRAVASEVGLTIPERPDATMRVAKHEGKSLYHRKGDGYQPTVHGERFLKSEYRVTKGTEARPTGDAE